MNEAGSRESLRSEDKVRVGEGESVRPNVLIDTARLLVRGMFVIHKGDSDVISSYHIYASCFSAML